MTKPPDYKAEAKEWLKAAFGNSVRWDGQDVESLAALLERLCGEALEAERKLHEPRIIQSPGFHIDPEDEA